MPISTINQNGLTNPLTSLASNTIQVSTGGSASAPAISKSDDTNTGMFFPAADTIAFTEGGTESMRINSAGQITMSSQPAFLVGRSSDVSVATGSPIIFNNVNTLNRGNHYSTSTGLFTAPVAGYYSFQVTVLISGLSNGTTAELSHAVNGSPTYNIGRYAYSAGVTGYDGLMSMASAISVYLNANDTFSIINNSTGSRTILGSTGWSRFSGFLIG